MAHSKFWLFVFIIFLFGSCVGLFHIHNADVWWHIAWGQQMLQQHTLFPLANFFYFTPTTTSYTRELLNTFLGDMGLALLFRWCGTTALQLLVLVCLFSGAYFLFHPWKKRLQKEPQWISLVLLLFLAFCLGTSQLQVVRNSIISLTLFPLALAIYVWHTRQRGWKIIAAYTSLFLIWSLIHPSYLLGILSLLLLYGGDFLENFLRRRSLSSSLPSCRALLTLTLLLFVTLTYSWQPRQLLTTTLTHSVSSLTHLFKKEYSSSSQELASKMTQPVWGNSAAPLSGDFIPTWKVMHHPAAWSSMLLALAAWLSLFFYRGPHKIGMLGLLALTTYFGCCYLRGTGYLTIVSIFILTAALPPMEIWPPRIAAMIIRGTTLAILIAIAGLIDLTFSKQSEFFFKEKGRVFGFGKAAVFDDAPYNFAKAHFLEAPCFTTIVTGSYASLLWKEQKKVFIDSFFAPHPNKLWKDYEALGAEQDSSLLDRYDVQIALVENSRLDWQNFFLNAPAWRPIAIGKGVTLYGKQNLISAEAPTEILFDRSEIASLALTERRALAAAYYNSILILQLHHLSQAATSTIEHDEKLFETLVTHLSPLQQGNIRLDPPGIKPFLLTP